MWKEKDKTHFKTLGKKKKKSIKNVSSCFKIKGVTGVKHFLSLQHLPRASAFALSSLWNGFLNLLWSLPPSLAPSALQRPFLLPSSAWGPLSPTPLPHTLPLFTPPRALLLSTYHRRLKFLWCLFGYWFLPSLCESLIDGQDFSAWLPAGTPLIMVAPCRCGLKTRNKDRTH